MCLIRGGICLPAPYKSQTLSPGHQHRAAIPLPAPTGALAGHRLPGRRQEELSPHRRPQEQLSRRHGPGDGWSGH